MAGGTCTPHGTAAHAITVAIKGARPFQREADVLCTEADARPGERRANSLSLRSETTPPKKKIKNKIKYTLGRTAVRGQDELTRTLLFFFRSFVYLWRENVSGGASDDRTECGFPLSNCAARLRKATKKRHAPHTRLHVKKENPSQLNEHVCEKKRKRRKVLFFLFHRHAAQRLASDQQHLTLGRTQNRTQDHRPCLGGLLVTQLYPRRSRSIFKKACHFI